MKQEECELPEEEYSYVNGVSVDKTDSGYELVLEVVGNAAGEPEKNRYTYGSINGEDWVPKD